MWRLYGVMGIVSYQLHTKRAVVDDLIVQVDVHQRLCLGAVVTGAKSDGHKSLVTHLGE